MRLIPLKPVSSPDCEPSAQVRISCLKTGKISPRWNEAAQAGWVADADGAPFAAYYSPEAASTLSPEEAKRLSDAARANRIYF